MSSVIEVPYQQISEQALSGLIEEYVNREGTDYGEYEYSLEDKVAQLKLALNSGSVVIVFDPALETTTLINKDEFKQLNG